MILSLLPLLAWADKTYKIDRIPQKLTIEVVTRVKIVKSNRNEIVLDDKKKEADQFEYKWDGDELILGRKQNYHRLNKHDYNYVTLYLTNPDEIKKIDINGVGSVDYESQATHPQLEIEICGASKASLNGNFGELELDISGASKVELKGTVRKIDLELSGASKFKANANVQSIKADISGASGCTIEGKGVEAEIEVSGMSNFDGRKYRVDRADIEVSGMSSVSVNASKYYRKDVSGLSSVRNHGKAR